MTDLQLYNYYAKIEKVVNIIENIPQILIRLIVRILKPIVKLKELVLQLISMLLRTTYTAMRWLTIPYNWIIVRTWLWYIFYGVGPEPLDVEGIHYLVAGPGGGKSTLMKQKMDEFMEQSGKTSYVTTKLEKPKIDEATQLKYVYHRWINIKHYYKDGKKVMQFNTRLHDRLFIDEFHVLNNNRNNKTREYNNFFIPFINDLVLLRHLGFKTIYLASQVPSNDIQLMSILVRYHEIKLKKGVDYWRWIRTGKFEIVPLKWRINTYQLEPLTMKKRLVRRWSKRVNMDYLEDFETLNMRNHGSHLKLDFVN